MSVAFPIYSGCIISRPTPVKISSEWRVDIINDMWEMGGYTNLLLKKGDSFVMELHEDAVITAHRLYVAGIYKGLIIDSRFYYVGHKALSYTIAQFDPNYTREFDYSISRWVYKKPPFPAMLTATSGTTSPAVSSPMVTKALNKTRTAPAIRCVGCTLATPTVKYSCDEWTVMIHDDCWGVGGYTNTLLQKGGRAEIEIVHDLVEDYYFLRIKGVELGISLDDLFYPVSHRAYNSPTAKPKLGYTRVWSIFSNKWDYVAPPPAIAPQPMTFASVNRFTTAGAPITLDDIKHAWKLLAPSHKSKEGCCGKCGCASNHAKVDLSGLCYSCNEARA